MILQALTEYYERKARSKDGSIAPPGFEYKEIPYVVVIDNAGNPVSLNCTYEGDEKKRRATSFLVPQAIKRTSGVAANLLWDQPEYALGIPLKDNPERTAIQHQAFIERINELSSSLDHLLNPLKAFMKIHDKKEALSAFEPTLSEMLKEGANLSFQLAGHQSLLCEQEEVYEALVKSQSELSGSPAICLITGNMEETEVTHPSIKRVRGAHSSGANIVSFNARSFESFQKDQGHNAPIGKTAAFSYTTALNHLLGQDSTQRMLIGDASTVFWAKKTTPLESHFIDFFEKPPKDDPDRNTRAVKDLFSSVESGVLPDEDASNDFYILGLSPNAARISIRFWISENVKSLYGKLYLHFKDIDIVHGSRQPDTLFLFRLLSSTAVAGKSSNVPPNLAGEMMRAILEGRPYPQSLLQAAVRRNKAEQEVNYPRAAIIKAVLNRSSRYSKSTRERELTVSLDEQNTNIGYRLGRLFATLEKIQQDANPGINATIRDRFYGAASGTPVAVFANLMRLKNHHLAKMEHAGRRIFFEKLITSIMESVNDFPPHLPLADQGRFAIGYYHQMQQFYTKKSETPQE